MLIVNIKGLVAMPGLSHMVCNLPQTDQVLGFVNADPVFLGKTGTF
jgi:hypothetical protein